MVEALKSLLKRTPTVDLTDEERKNCGNLETELQRLDLDMQVYNTLTCPYHSRDIAELREICYAAQR